MSKGGIFQTEFSSKRECLVRVELRLNLLAKLITLVCLFVSAETPGNFNRVIINDDLDRAYNEFHDTVSKVNITYTYIIILIW